MLREIIESGDAATLSSALRKQPELADMPIAFGPANRHRVHPLHYLCDCVFEGKLEEAVALQMARQLVAAGADINGPGNGAGEVTTADSLLIAATSLLCENIAILLIDQGADIHRRGTHGGTALHWAAWTGSDRVVERLLREPVLLDDQQDEFASTPLLWAINGLLNARGPNQRNQPRVLALLMEAGADPNAVDGRGRRALDVLSRAEHPALVKLLEQGGGRRS